MVVLGVADARAGQLAAAGHGVEYQYWAVHPSKTRKNMLHFTLNLKFVNSFCNG